MAQHSCALVQELAETLGPSFDPFVDLLLPNLGKMAYVRDVRYAHGDANVDRGFTKRITAEKSQKAVTAILVHSSPTPTKMIGHIAAAIQDKSVQTRQYGASHLKTYLECRAQDHKITVESAPGVLELIVNLLKKCLADTNPMVREPGRSAFWSFHRVWPDHASTLMTSLDVGARKQLEKANPRTTSTPVSSRISKTKTPRSSALSALLAAKRAQASELAARRAAEGDDPKQPIIETLPERASPRATPRSSSPARSEGTVPPRKGAESPSPAPSSAVFVSSTTALAPAVEEDVDAEKSGEDEEVSGGARVVEDIGAGNGPTLSLPASPSEIIGKLQSPSLHEATVQADLSHARPRAPMDLLPEDQGQTMPGGDLQASTSSGGSATKALRTTKSSTRKSGIPVRSPPRRDSSPLSSPRPTPAQRSPLASSVSMASALSRTTSQSPSLKIDPTQPDPRQAWGYETPSHFPPTSREPKLPQPRSPFEDTLSRGDGPPTQIVDHLPNSPADEQIRAQAAQAFSAAQQLLDFDDDQDAIDDVPITPSRPPAKVALSSSAYRTPLPAFRMPARQSWEDSPRPVTPKLLQVLQSRGYERSWWNERRKLLDQMDISKKDTPLTSDAIQLSVERLVSGEPTVSDLQALALFSASHPVTGSADSVNSKVVPSYQMWSETRLFDRIFDGLVSLLRPALVSKLLALSSLTTTRLPTSLNKGS